VSEAKRSKLGWVTEFFRLALSHDTLANVMKTNHLLMSRYKYSLTELEDMIPWERDIYVALLIQDLKEQAQKKAES
jgi:hypothetical protein